MQRRSSMAVGHLLVNPRNVRTHSKRQIHQIACSIREFGFRNPILIDEAAVIIAGRSRLAAAKELGVSEVPVIEVHGLSDGNWTGAGAGGQQDCRQRRLRLELLALELQELSQLELSFDLEVTGFDIAEIDLLFDGAKASPTDDPADQAPPVEPRGGVAGRRLMAAGRTQVVMRRCPRSDRAHFFRQSATLAAGKATSKIDPCG